MKKIILIVFLIVLSGCFNSTPIKEVEKYFTKYQTNPDNIENTDLFDFTNYSEEQKEEYKNIIKNNYRSLVYKIKDDRIDGNKATIIVEIEVYDYSKTMKEVIEYRNQYINEFYIDNLYNESKYIDYKNKKLKEVTDRVKYTLDITLTKIDRKWYLDELPREYLEKINGIYNY